MMRALLILLALCGSADAHDHWIRNGEYKAPTGEHCCGLNDCFVVDQTDVEASVAGWLIKSLNEVIPYSETLISEDRDFWRCKRVDGSRRCFFAPNQGF